MKSEACAPIVISVVLLCVATCSGDRNYKGYTVYSPAPTAENYYVYTGFSMSEGDFTLCLWWRLLTLGESSSSRFTLTSIAVEAHDDLYNARLRASNGVVKLNIRSDGAWSAEQDLSSDFNISDWTYTCTMSAYSPSASGSTNILTKVYHLYGNDTEWSEIMDYSPSDITKISVAGDAGIALYQDQDNVGGGFDATQATDGWRACLNIWNGTYSADELLRFSECEERGDIFSMSESVGEIGGDVNGYCVTPRNDGTSVEKLIRDTDSAYFCMIEAKVLSDLTLPTATVTSRLQCATMCTVRDDCYSANYYPATGICELGARGESLQPERLVTSTDGVHISFLFCGC